MQKLVWQNANGVELDLTSGNYGITEWEGFSNTSLNIQSQQVPFQDGGVFLDALMEQREMTITLAIQDNNNLSLRYQQRRELISALNPKLGEGYLIYTNDYISKRIKCIPQIPIFETHNSDTAGTPKASLSWTACEPYWEDLEETEITFDNTTQPVIENNGDIPTQLKIDWFTNYVKNGKLTNITTNKKIQYNGDLNKSVHIDTNLGQKKVISEDVNYRTTTTGNYLHSIVYSKSLGIFIAVGNNGTVLTSKDSIIWECVNLGSSLDLFSITYSETLGLFIIGGESGTNTQVFTSPDGITWTSRIVSTTYRTEINSIVYSELQELFVAVANNGCIFTSPDGINWTYRASGVSVPLYNIIYNTTNSIFIIVGDSGTILTSADGITWTNRVSSVSDYLMSITYADDIGLFVIVGGGLSTCVILTSTDGITWNQISDIPVNHSLYSVVYSQEKRRFVAVGSMGNIICSQDGVNWGNEIQITGITTLACITYSDYYGFFILVGTSGAIFTSVDGNIWTPCMKSPIGDIKGIIYKNIGNKYIMVGENQVAISTDTVIWERVLYTLGTNFNSICSTKNQELFVVVGNNGYIFTSPDGITWTQQTSGVGSGINLYSVVYSEKLGIFATVGKSGTVLTSTDGATWVSRTSGVSDDLNSIIYSEEQEQFISVGSNGVVILSQDGITWNNQTPITTYKLNNIIFADVFNFYIAIGNNGVIFTSVNGTIWVEQTSGTTNDLYGLVYSTDFGLLFAVGNKGTVLTSSDAITWGKENIVETKLNTVSSGKDAVLIGGANGEFFQASLIPAENEIGNITIDSDMNLNLVNGKNVFRINKEEGNMIVRIIFRQKYIGV